MLVELEFISPTRDHSCLIRVLFGEIIHQQLFGNGVIGVKIGAMWLIIRDLKASVLNYSPIIHRFGDL